ncbi:hypothetical protein KFK09_006509 [Dendrobium nobile]|uniref:DUF4283 domain-containing protein n=1 Tax=Dendrobium nobile TaxID=94219 RepID=A0A8T3BRV0_DENNO|nr:hypothetical protein KFK09_006509 [Dendrobium nobile]
MGWLLPVSVLVAELSRRWSPFGEMEFVSTGPNSVLCLFQSTEAWDAVLSGGPWIIAGNILGMDKWSFSYSPASLNGLRSPIWIRLPQLPLLYWDYNNLNRLAHMLGEPLWMDGLTSRRGRSSFARICVRIDLSRNLLPGVWINGLHGRFFQKVEYEGLSSVCTSCGSLAHRAN